jgi:hypothetical protein
MRFDVDFADASFSRPFGKKRNVSSPKGLALRVLAHAELTRPTDKTAK